MINPLRRKQIGKAYLEALSMAGGYALEDARLMGFVADLIRPEPTLAEHGMVKHFLKEAKMIRMTQDPLDPEMKQWVLTELGRNHVASL